MAKKKNLTPTESMELVLKLTQVGAEQSKRVRNFSLTMFIGATGMHHNYCYCFKNLSLFFLFR
jgi:hypothetical protein